jgi:hypothetical protein
MNLLGRIFIVLILIMSIGFMFSAMVVYSTHKNWRELAVGPGGLQERLTQAQANFNELQTQYNRLESQLRTELETRDQEIRKLETERVAQNERNTDIQNELEQLRQAQRDSTAAVVVAQQDNERLAAQVNDLRQEIRTNQQLRDQAFATTLQATEELHQTAAELESAEERKQQLTQQVANMTTVMRESGLNPTTDPNAVVPRVDGFVTQIRRSNGSQFVEITIGADDGLKAGDTIEVYRGDKYLGRVEILRTSPDKAVGRIDRRFQQGQIQEGDRVATRLKLG